jgi:hypothetical protein
MPGVKVKLGIIKPVQMHISPADVLHGFLENQLAFSEHKLVVNKGIEEVLRQAVEGLKALRYGEVQDIFAPKKKTTHDGTKPYTLRKLRMVANGFIDLLLKKEHEDPVIRKVADAFGEKADTVRGWRKSKVLGKTRDSLMRSYRKEISERTDWDEKRVLAELNKTGAEYRRQRKLAFQFKKGK